MDFHKLISAPFEFLSHYGVPFVLVLSILVFIHEWGHYIVARLCGVKIENFSIGFGRELFGRTDKNGTRWKVCMIPLGGYVQMFGDTDPASARHAEGIDDGKEVRPLNDEEKRVAFYTQPLGKRAAIVVAGPAINYIFAIIVMTALFAFQGQPYTPPIAASIVENSAASDAGIQPDDKILTIDGDKINTFEDIHGRADLALDRKMTIELVHSTGKGQWSDKPVTITLTPRRIIETDRFGFRHESGRIGIVAPPGASEMRPHTPVSAFAAALKETGRITVDTLKALGQMIIGTRPADELGGILRIGAYAGEFAQKGIIALITFAALLSINLGLINLMPVPMLDGGHLAFYAMEKLRGRPLSEHIQEYVLRVGFVFLLGIMFFATWNDLSQMNVFDAVKHILKRT